MSNIVNGVLEYRQFIVLEDGKEVQVRYNQDPTLYEGTDVTLYAYTAKEGKGVDAKEVTRYAVAVEDARRAKRSTAEDKILSLVAQGLTPDQIIEKLTKGKITK